mgnify:FL=1
MPIDSSILLTSMDERGVMTLTLNRPDAFNAMSEALLEALQACITDMSEDPNLRVVVIQANGKACCAGHDLKEMRA